MAEQKKSGCLGCLALAIGVPILLFVAAILFSPGDKRTPEEKERSASGITAYLTAKKAVLEKLKAPSTAKFGDHTVTQDETGYSVAGYVDAQNSFGAPIRSKYLVRIEKGSWRVLNAVVW